MPAINAVASAASADVDIGGRALGVIWTMVVIAFVTVLARLYTQIRITRQLGLSDYLIVIALSITTSWASLISVQYHYGWGHHQSDLEGYNLSQALKFNAICQSFGIMGSTFGRLSFIILMFKLFAITKRQRTAFWGLFTAQLITNSVVTICLYVQCTNVELLWDFTAPGTCWPADVQTYLGYAHSAFNGATDLFLTCYPAVIVWNLSLNTRLKFGVGALLALSIFAFIAVIMKIVYLNALANRGDYTYETVPLFTWVTVESVCIIFASSVPLLRPLFLKLTGKQTTTVPSYEMHSGSRSNQNSSYRAFSKLRAQQSVDPMDDNKSEERILPGDKNDIRIFVERDTEVRYSETKEGPPKHPW